MTFKVELPKEKSSIIKVMGVGQGGCNAVNYMFQNGIQGVDFCVCNTDAQVLEASPIPNKIQLGAETNEGLGAGADPEVGKKAAIESMNEIQETLGVNTKMLFITAGMGGGTGTGAAPVIAEMAKEAGILTVAIVTTPFGMEGSHRSNIASDGVEELKKHVDSILVISNDRLKEIYGKLPITKAFAHADEILNTAAKGISEMITVQGIINVDFRDVYNVMKNGGNVIMGTGTSTGQDRATDAAKEAIASPLLDDDKLSGAKKMLVQVAYGPEEELTLEEFDTICNFVRDESGVDTILKASFNENQHLGNGIKVTIIATDFSPRENLPKEGVEMAELDQHIQIEIDTMHEGILESSTDQNKGQRIDLFGENKDHQPMDSEMMENKRKHIDQAKRLKELSKLHEKANDEMEEMEGTPAYKRNGVKLAQVNHSSQTELTKWSLFDKEGQPMPKSNNSFLHDQVD